VCHARDGGARRQAARRRGHKAGKAVTLAPPAGEHRRRGCRLANLTVGTAPGSCGDLSSGRSPKRSADRRPAADRDRADRPDHERPGPRGLPAQGRAVGAHPAPDVSLEQRPWGRWRPIQHEDAGRPCRRRLPLPPPPALHHPNLPPHAVPRSARHRAALRASLRHAPCRAPLAANPFWRLGSEMKAVMRGTVDRVLPNRRACRADTRPVSERASARRPAGRPAGSFPGSGSGRRA
jgi:hypothetical protein